MTPTPPHRCLLLASLLGSSSALVVSTAPVRPAAYDLSWAPTSQPLHLDEFHDTPPHLDALPELPQMELDDMQMLDVELSDFESDLVAWTALGEQSTLAYEDAFFFEGDDQLAVEEESLSYSAALRM